MAKKKHQIIREADTLNGLCTKQKLRAKPKLRTQPITITCSLCSAPRLKTQLI